MSDHITEFRAGESRHYNQKSPGRWVLSHVMRYPWLPILALCCSVLNNLGFSWRQLAVGHVFDVIGAPGWTWQALVAAALAIAFAGVLQGLAGIVRNMSFEFLAQKLERDCRAELYESLLGKSQTWHSRQRIGDIMARATNDVHFVNLMFSPGLALILDSAITAIVPLLMILTIDWRLLLVPALFMVGLVVTVWIYNRTLNPLTDEQRESFGAMNATIADTLEGIEAVKGAVAEERELGKFATAAKKLRDLYVRIALVQGRYWPLLVFAVCWGLAFLHALTLYTAGSLTVGQVIGYMMLFNGFEFTTFISIFSFNLFQMGLSSAGRVLETIKSVTELDENPSGVSRKIEGKVEFRDVSFSFGDSPVLHNVSFVAKPGETVAIVGRTGSGKTSLVKLVNRVFDADSGQVLVDGIDVRDWRLEDLRSQVASIEQDVFLFSRSIRANIAFGAESADSQSIEEAAREAQAHDFIMSFDKGYDTEVGERGVTLSGGQKQRVALARAFLVNPRILILDDSTSAVDSRTEDEIQKAMRRASAGRTTFLITHRLSQIRWADHILLLAGGRLAAEGTHEELLAKSEDYRRLFARV
jgi:ATP-binding cassette subfamily B protein